MIQFLNNIINKIIVVFKYLTYAVVLAIWIVSYPFYRISYQWAKHNTTSAFLNHPNFILLNRIMKVNKYFNKFIF